MLPQPVRWAIPLAILLGPLPTAVAAEVPRCDSSTTLTLLGIDTEASLLLLAFRAEGGRWLAEVRLDEPAARAVVDGAAGRRFGVSIGAGMVMAGSSCGPRCVQVLRWSGSGWEPFGDPLRASDQLSLEGTWDGSGQPWVALLGPGSEPGILSATAFRREAGQWREKGGLAVRAAGSPALAPDPTDPEAVVIGTGRFHARDRPEHWLLDLPGVEQAAGGRVVPLGGGRAAFLKRETSIHFSRDRGRSWQQMLRQPWATGEGDLAWRPGRHYWVDLPDGSLAPPLATLWVDSRVAHRRQLYVAELAAEGHWRILYRGPEGILTDGGDLLTFDHVVRWGTDHWLLLSGCVGRSEGGALAWRQIRDGSVGPPEVVPLRLSTP